MKREDFVTFLNKYDLRIPLEREGEYAGLPEQLQDALHVADVARTMGMPAPSSDEIRGWYQSSSPARSRHNPALQAIESLNQLYSDDLAALNLGELLLFANKCATVADVARAAFHHRRDRLDISVGKPQCV